jgi:hypothetical protein
MKAEDFGALETAKLLNGPFKIPTVPWEDRFNHQAAQVRSSAGIRKQQDFYTL